MSNSSNPEPVRPRGAIEPSTFCCPDCGASDAWEVETTTYDRCFGPVLTANSPNSVPYMDYNAGGYESVNGPNDGDESLYCGECGYTVSPFFDQMGEWADVPNDPNERRADRGRLAVANVAAATGMYGMDGSAYLAAKDTLTNILHFADRMGVEPSVIVNAALEAYRGDLEDGPRAERRIDPDLSMQQADDLCDQERWTDALKARKAREAVS